MSDHAKEFVTEVAGWHGIGVTGQLIVDGPVGPHLPDPVRGEAFVAIGAPTNGEFPLSFWNDRGRLAAFWLPVEKLGALADALAGAVGEGPKTNPDSVVGLGEGEGEGRVSRFAAEPSEEAWRLFWTAWDDAEMAGARPHEKAQRALRAAFPQVVADSRSSTEAETLAAHDVQVLADAVKVASEWVHTQFPGSRTMRQDSVVTALDRAMDVLMNAPLVAVLPPQEALNVSSSVVSEEGLDDETHFVRGASDPPYYPPAVAEFLRERSERSQTGESRPPSVPGNGPNYQAAAAELDRLNRKAVAGFQRADIDAVTEIVVNAALDWGERG